MVFNRIKNKMLLLCAVCCCFAPFLPGCGPQNYKAEADEKVYNIIDKKWDDEFGRKVNYKISDVDPDPNSIALEDKPSVSGTITLAQAVAIATAGNREYQTQKELLYTSALDLDLQRHEFENQYFGGAFFGYGRDGVSREEAIAAGANVGFNRLLATGTQISAQIAVSWAKILLGDRLATGVAPLLGVSVVQPLLRGSSPEVVMENLTQAERDTLYRIRAFNRFRKEFVVSVITQYYQVLELQDIMQNTRRNYNALVDIYEKTKKLTEGGRLPKYELDRVHQEILATVDTYLQTQKQYEQTLDDFKITLAVPTTTELTLDSNELQRLRSAEMTYPDFPETVAVETALLRRLDVVNTADRVIDARRKVRVAADALRAELNLGATLEGESEESFDIPGIDNVNAIIDLDLPLEREAEKNAYRKALIAVSRARRDYDLARDTTALEIRRAYRDMVEAAERYRIQAEALGVAEKRYSDTKLMLKFGRASSRRLINAQEDLYQARNTATQALVNYTVATMNFYRDSGVLRVLPDGMWRVNSEAATAAK